MAENKLPTVNLWATLRENPLMSPVRFWSLNPKSVSMLLASITLIYAYGPSYSHYRKCFVKLIIGPTSFGVSVLPRLDC